MMNPEIKVIDNEVWKCTKITPDEMLLVDLQKIADEYEVLTLDVLELEKKISEQDRYLKEMEFTIDYEIINAKDGDKAQFSNEKKRELEKEKRLKENNIYIECLKAKLNAQSEGRLKKGRLDILNFQAGIYKRILEYKSHSLPD